MFYHIGAFSFSTVTGSLTWVSYIWIAVSTTTLSNLSWRTNYLLYVGEVFEFGLFISTIPLFFILNSLLNKGIADKEQEDFQLCSDEASDRRTSINEPDLSKSMIHDDHPLNSLIGSQNGVLQ